MIFLPKNFEILTCALRNTMQRLILKNGIKEKYLINLRKIHLAEALYSNQKLPVNIYDYSLSLLKAARDKKAGTNKGFDYSADFIDNVIINPKLYTAVLLSICNKSSRISLSSDRGKLVIKAELNGNFQFRKIPDYTFLKEINSGRLVVIINAEKTKKPAIKYETDSEYFLNPLSVINIYL